MSGVEGVAGQSADDSNKANDASDGQSYSGPSQGPAFHSQFEHFPSSQTSFAGNAGSYSQQAFHMGGMAAALPQSPQYNPLGPTQYASPAASGTPPGYPAHQNAQYHAGRPLQFDPAMLARMQQQQGPPQPYMGHGYAQQQHPSALQRGPQTFGQYGHVDPYAYAMSGMQMPQFDSRFSHQQPFGMARAMSGDMSPYMRRVSEPAPIPSFPRGPPRKPRQSGHALWVGNLPPAATVTDLKDHFSRDATRDIESLFLISKSNCAFVNYRSEAACTAAMNRFHDSRFHGVRLVCRLRRGTTASTASNPSAAPAEGPVISPAEASRIDGDDRVSPIIVESPTTAATQGARSVEEAEAPAGTEEAERVQEKFFIVKSLTVQDLEASVSNGVWATQTHNEAALSRAYETADSVFLIFSANKSGEYFGYARMTSAISGEPVNLSSGAGASSSLAPTSEPFSSDDPHASSAGAPQSIPTPATATAPKGHIIDDSARGTIFWEADHSDREEQQERDDSPDKEGDETAGPSAGRGGGGDGQNWGRQFSVEWVSTQRLPFYRTRGLRNPWNANREVKIARDGTELEPSVGRRLVQMFHRAPQSPSHLTPQQHGMPYR